MIVGRLARPLQAAAIGAVLATAPVQGGRADQLAEFFFWNEMGNAAGLAAKSISDYRNERALWANNIAAAKEELARCGGCPAAKAKLKKWQGIENRFQDIAGSLLASVGTPPVVADFLDIELPLSPGISTEQRKKECAIRRPNWVDQAPEFCQQAVDRYLSCVRGYEEMNGYCSAAVAIQPGRECWDTRKLLKHCANKDYAAFEREKSAQALRQSRPNTPEYVDYGRDKFVMYGRVGDDFVPAMPPPEMIRPLFEDPAFIRLEFSMIKTGTPNLRKIEIERFFWNIIAPNAACFTGRAPENETTLRICDDLSEMSWRDRAPIIACWYARSEGRRVPDAVYWYGETPASADPKVLLERAAGHPLLRVRQPRTDCPGTLESAEAIERERGQKLASLGIQQIPESVELPRSEWRARQQREYEQRRKSEMSARLDAFPIVGQYGLMARKEVGTRNLRTKQIGNARCSISAASKTEFSILCKHRRREFSGTAVRKEDALLVTWSSGEQVLYRVNSGGKGLFGKPVGAPIQRGYFETLHRKGTYSTAEIAEMVAKLPITGRYDLELSHGGATKTLYCNVERDGRSTPNRFPIMCYNKNGTAHDGEGTADGRDPLSLWFASWDPGKLEVGGQWVRNLRFPIDANRPDAELPSLEGAADNGVSARLVRADPTAPLPFGAPLEALPEIKEGQAQSARAKGIVSLEQLAALGDEEANALGVGWIWRRDLARTYLKNGGDGGKVEPGPVTKDRAVAVTKDARAADAADDRAARRAAAATAAKGKSAPGASDGPAARRKARMEARIAARRASAAPPPALPGSPEPTSATPSRHCTPGSIAGSYSSGFGTMTCKAVADGLDCCYGGRSCSKRLELSLDAERGKLVGEWIYSNGKRGPVEFGVNAHCELTSGVWGRKMGQLNSSWSVRDRH
jgi:hypothetical protein